MAGAIPRVLHLGLIFQIDKRCNFCEKSWCHKSTICQIPEKDVGKPGL